MAWNLKSDLFRNGVRRLSKNLPQSDSRQDGSTLKHSSVEGEEVELEIEPSPWNVVYFWNDVSGWGDFPNLEDIGIGSSFERGCLKSDTIQRAWERRREREKSSQIIVTLLISFYSQRFLRRVLYRKAYCITLVSTHSFS